MECRLEAKATHLPPTDAVAILCGGVCFFVFHTIAANDFASWRAVADLDRLE
jgi:hypothetical protein